MTTKNLLDNSHNGRPAIFSDLTGNVTYEPRADIAETLTFLHESYASMMSSNPKPEMFAVRFAVGVICLHMGWLPYEIAAAEQYVTQQNATSEQPVG